MEVVAGEEKGRRQWVVVSGAKDVEEIKFCFQNKNLKTTVLETKTVIKCAIIFQFPNLTKTEVRRQVTRTLPNRDLVSKCNLQ